jgi:phage baseplate assembly protein V
MDPIELSRRLENLIRLGTIHSIDHAAVRVRVQTGRLVTQWLPWLEHRAGATTSWDPPTVGEQCVILSPSGEPAGGIVLRGLHSATIEPPSHSPDTHVIKFPDGAVVSYDHADSHLDVSGIQTARIQAAVSVTLDTPLTHCTGKLEVDDLLTYHNGLAGTGGSNANTVTGNFTHTDGSLSSNGIVLDTHIHTGVYPGGGTSGGPA